MQFTCSHCNQIFERSKRLAHNITHKGMKPFCSTKCCSDSKRVRSNHSCLVCHSTFERLDCQAKKSKNHFCSRSCCAKYTNANKTTGTRVSKLEKWLQTNLQELYPIIEFIFNSSTEVGLELDIYLPKLKLAFELNGIFHYEPIFGQDKLNKTKFNDNQKYQACIVKGISLCVIDTSSQSYFKESTSQKYLDIIKNIIDSVINQG